MNMGLPQDSSPSKEGSSPIEAPYPAQTKQAAAEIDGTLTEVMTIFFSDRIMVSISQEGRLAQWVS
jgi:proteasome assembly chaperone 3